MEPNPIMPGDVAGWCCVQNLVDVQLVEDIWKVVRLVDQHRMGEFREAQNNSKQGSKK